MSNLYVLEQRKYKGLHFNVFYPLKLTARGLNGLQLSGLRVLQRVREEDKLKPVQSQPQLSMVVLAVQLILHVPQTTCRRIAIK